MLKPGDKAPLFEGIDQDGNPIKMESLLGSKIVLYFYPKDNTPGCTAEACDIRDNHNKFIEQGYKIIGVSKDSPSSHKKFIEKYNLPFTLISDQETTILQMYDAWGEKKFMGKQYMGILRKTFVIDQEGIITNIIEKVDTKNHSKQILG